MVSTIDGVAGDCLFAEELLPDGEIAVVRVAIADRRFSYANPELLTSEPEVQ